MEVIWTGSRLLAAIGRIISQGPKPEVETEIASACAEAIGLHLTMLILTASDANLSGRHSCALALFRAMEDALDCFAAVSLVPDAAEKWAKGRLKASKAASLWEHRLGDTVLPSGEKAIEYRKGLRTYFNGFAHCSPYLTDWNMYPEFDTRELVEPARELTARFRVNHHQDILDQNALRIGAYLAAHAIEFAAVVEMAYGRFLLHNPDLKRELRQSKNDLEKVLEKEFGAVYLEEMPPQLKRPLLRDPSHPDLVIPLGPLLDRDEEDSPADDSR